MLAWKTQLRNEVETVRQTRREGGRDNKGKYSPNQMAVLWKLREHVINTFWLNEPQVSS